MQTLNIFVVSDSSGETAISTLQTAISQFPKIKVKIKRFPFTTSKERLLTILETAKEQHALIFHTLMKHDFSSIIIDFCRQNNLTQYDALNSAIATLSAVTGQQPVQEPGINHSLTDAYFDRIAAMEFAVTNDDGKNPAGFLAADLVLVGVSRTSKTPLSLFLANQNFRVANLPLVPHTEVPKELWDVDPAKIVGLTNSPAILEKIRQQRLISYGMNPDSNYTDQKQIHQELEHANEIFKKLGCLVINVANKSIEETATLITTELGLDPMMMD